MRRLYAKIWQRFNKPDYEIWITDVLGNRMRFVGDIVTLLVTKAVNSFGRVVVDLSPKFPEKMIQLDGHIEIWRTVGGGAQRNIAVGAIRDQHRIINAAGIKVLRVAGPDKVDLLNSRIVDYTAGSSEATKSGPADDIMKDIVRENLGADAPSERDLSNVNFTVEENHGEGPVVSKGFSHRNVLSVLRELHDASVKEGTPIYFDVLPRMLDDGKIGFEFVTFIGLRGKDRGSSSDSPLLFSYDKGNLENAVLSLERSEEATRVIAGGQGEGADRVKRYANDVARQQESPWNLREVFVDARDQANEDEVQTRADEVLAAKIPRWRFTADLLDSPGTRFIEDWDIGDRVVVEMFGWQSDADITGYNLRLMPNGDEVVTVRSKIMET